MSTPYFWVHTLNTAHTILAHISHAFTPTWFTPYFWVHTEHVFTTNILLGLVARPDRHFSKAAAPPSLSRLSVTFHDTKGYGSAWAEGTAQQTPAMALHRPCS